VPTAIQFTVRTREIKMNKSASRIGDITELELCHYFLNDGYEVFRNVSSTGPVDFVVLDINSGELTMYDSKTANVHTKKDGRKIIYLSNINEKQKELGVKLVSKYGKKILTDTRIEL
jgi:hypothetical protein